MDFSNIKLMQMMQVKMAWHSENQDILAGNIANSDTPGFKAKKLRDLDFKRLATIEAHRLKVRATSPAHMTGTKERQDFRIDEQRKTHETTPVENSIALEEQMAKMAHNKHEYTLTSNLYTKTAQMFKTAIGNQR